MKFKSVDHALRFAFDVSASEIIKMAKLEMDDSPSTAPSRVSPQERHGEAALIIGAASRLLPSDCQCYVAAKYAHDEAVQRSAILSLLSAHIVPSLGIKNTDMAIELAIRYFMRERRGNQRLKGSTHSCSSIAARYGMYKKTPAYWEGKIAAFVADIAERTDSIIGDYLIEKDRLVDFC